MIFMFNSADHNFCPANKSQISKMANAFLQKIAEHGFVSANKCENANYSLHLHV